jgi:peptide subunit release factor 1 (eRF1)
MISRQDLQRLIDRQSRGLPILSLFLDMSVNSDNKRTHQIFLNQKQAEFDDLDSDRARHHRAAIGSVFARVDDWLDDEYREENRGVVIYAEIGGDWFEAMQFPIAVQNRMVVGERPVIGPLAQVLESYHHLGVVLLDREHVRILSVYLGTLLDEIEVRGEPIPAAHDVQPGGFSQKRYQRRKYEETKHFFKEFSREVEEFVRRYKPKDLVILGTDENVAKFREFLSDRVLGLVLYTGAMPVDEPASEVMQRVEPHLRAEWEREDGEVVGTLLDRVREDYLATAGLQSTLTALQEGKVDTLVVARNLAGTGARCSGCGFVFGRSVQHCSYCGSAEFQEVDAIEEVIRLAEVQGAVVEFVDPELVSEVSGVGSLLRF